MHSREASAQKIDKKKILNINKMLSKEMLLKYGANSVLHPLALRSFFLLPSACISMFVGTSDVYLNRLIMCSQGLSGSWYSRAVGCNGLFGIVSAAILVPEYDVLCCDSLMGF